MALARLPQAYAQLRQQTSQFGPVSKLVRERTTEWKYGSSLSLEYYTGQLSDDFELVPADGALEPPEASPHVLPDLEDWELVSPEDADLSI